MAELIWKGFLETLFMTGASTLIGIVLGGPLAVFLFLTQPRGLSQCPWLYHGLGFFINASRSVPYIILTVLLIPLTRLLTGSSIGTASAVVPLGLSAVLLTARVFEEVLNTLPKGYLELGISLGASHRQMITRILVPEALPGMISGLTLIIISLTGFSAMAGMVGGGGLGDLAIRYGYQRYDLPVLMIIIVIMIAWVQLIQMFGNFLSKKLQK